MKFVASLAVGALAGMLLVGGVPCSIAHAVSLIDQGSNTYDTNTGLTWLDVRLTMGVSYDNVEANYLGVGQLYAGYRHATATEVTTLFTNGGVTSPYNGSLNSEAPALDALISLLGATSSVPGSYKQVYGQINNATSLGDHYVSLLFLSTTTQIANVQWTTFPPYSTGTGIIGHFLVLDPSAAVPLPPALPLFGAGLVLIGLLGRHKKRKAAAVPG